MTATEEPPPAPAAVAREPHPIFSLLAPEIEQALPADKVAEYYALRSESIKLAESDPLRYGYESADWKLADEKLAQFRAENPVGVLLFIVLGGIRASKTEWRSKRIVENMLTKRDYIAWACHTTQSSSRDAQQKKIYKYIPPEYRPDSGRFRQGMKAKINYTPWGGFTTDDFALPDPEAGVSICGFKFYGMNARSLEGTEINEGWMDEESEVEWLEALIGRCATRNGVVYLTFTGKSGYTQLLRTILSGAMTLEEVEAPMLPLKDAAGNVIGHEKVPKVQVNYNVEINAGADGQKRIKAKAMIVYFHAENNPFANYPALQETYKDANRETILNLIYGVVNKTQGSRFPLFSDLVHKPSLNRFAEIQKGGGTWYHFLDPCSSRNWFHIFVFIDPLHRVFVRLESPSHGHEEAYIPGIGDPGPWAAPGAAKDGMAGEGQKEWGWGYRRYLEEMARLQALLAGGSLLPEWNDARMELEPWDKYPELLARYSKVIPVYEHWIDARYGNAKRTREEESTTLIEELEDLGIRFLAAPTPAGTILPSTSSDGSLRMINDRLYYNNRRPIDATNEPKLYVCESCPNTIYALKEWTGLDGQHGACKDPIDCLRMLVLSDVRYVDPELFVPSVPWMTMRR